MRRDVQPPAQHGGIRILPFTPPHMPPPRPPSSPAYSPTNGRRRACRSICCLGGRGPRATAGRQR